MRQLRVIDFLLRSFAAHSDEIAVIWRDRQVRYSWLIERMEFWNKTLDGKNVKPGSIVILEGDFSADSISLFLTLTERRCILVPLTNTVSARRSQFIEIAEGEVSIGLDSSDDVTISHTGRVAAHEHYRTLRRLGHPGLVLFSSGSTGQPKATVHDLALLLEKFRAPRKPLRTLPFLLFDHIGGVNTMLHVLSNGGCLVTVSERTPDGVLAAVARHKVQLLPTSPTFINLILLSEAYTRHDMSSLELVTYGTEPMPEATLRRFHDLFPQIRLLQTYGMSEIGILRSQSRSSNSLWLRIGGEGYETRVVDGVLHVKAASAMLGYLNAPSPFTEDGWMNTGDIVDVDGEFIRFRGRVSEVINVGGEKVFPVEVEAVIRQHDNVAEVGVYGEKNPITGNIVCAEIVLKRDEDEHEFTRRLKRFCSERMRRYKVPVKVEIVKGDLHGQRFKKMRHKT
jgi:acyl-CoA synthetase (AMP-forming)/AMP-acid ligase II